MATGLEIFGAAAAALALTQQVVQSLQWAQTQRDIWKRAGKERSELWAQADNMAANLSTIHSTLSRSEVQKAFDLNPAWLKFADSALSSCHILLEDLRKYIPDAEVEGQVAKPGWLEKLKRTFNNEKTTNFARRAVDANQMLGQLMTCELMFVDRKASRCWVSG